MHHDTIVASHFIFRLTWPSILFKVILYLKKKKIKFQFKEKKTLEIFESKQVDITFRLEITADVFFSQIFPEKETQIEIDSNFQIRYL